MIFRAVIVYWLLGAASRWDRLSIMRWASSIAGRLYGSARSTVRFTVLEIMQVSGFWQIRLLDSLTLAGCVLPTVVRLIAINPITDSTPGWMVFQVRSSQEYSCNSLRSKGFYVCILLSLTLGTFSLKRWCIYLLLNDDEDPAMVTPLAHRGSAVHGLRTLR